MKKNKNRVQISSKLVKEILKNLGTSKKVAAAAAEKFLGPSFDFLVRHGGVPNFYQNRDRLVAAITLVLHNSMWTLKREDD